MDSLSDAARRLIAVAMEQPPASGGGDAEIATLATRATQPITRGPTAQLDVHDAIFPDDVRRIGRYFVLERIGVGAMGVVLRAYDPELQRAVALKLVHPSFASEAQAAEACRRLVAEARALARLAHPNVTVVHDVGVHEGTVWIAMELVEGRDLAAWLAAAPRAWPDVLRVFREAARGLHAAHCAGLLHRDFKPANVLIGIDDPSGRPGRARVSDFGLARAGEPIVALPSSEPSTLGPSDPSMTGDGVVMGTPAYMAPEQHAGRELTAAADQFAFFVALYEALWHGRPYRGALVELALAKREPPPEPLEQGRVPGWVWPIVQRGLSPDPAARWPDLDAVASALRGPKPRARRSAVLAGLVAVAGLAAFAVTRSPAPCTGGAAELAAVWSPAIADEIDAAFAGTKLAGAPHEAALVRARLDAWGEQWIAAHAEACQATRVRGEVSEAMLDRRMTCLAERRRTVAALVDELRTADAAMIGRAVSSVDDLPALEPCSDLVALAQDHQLPEDPDERAAVEDARDELLILRTRIQLGREQGALVQLEQLRERARALDWSPLTAAVEVVYARALEEAGRIEDAVKVTREALWLAEAAGNDGAVADAATHLVYLEGGVLEHPDRAVEWGRFVEATIERMGGDPPRERNLVGVLAPVYAALGQYDQATALFEEAIELDRQAGRTGVRAAPTFNNYAIVLFPQHRFEEALAKLEEGIEMVQRDVGDDHPLLGDLYLNAGHALTMMGRLDEAQRSLERALAVYERTHGPDYPAIADVTARLGLVAERRGSTDEALGYYRRAIDSARGGSELRTLGTTLTSLGRVELAQGHDAEAATALAEGLAVLEGVGHEHPILIETLYWLAKARVGLGQRDEAVALFRRAHAIASAAKGPHASDTLELEAELAALASEPR